MRFLLVGNGWRIAQLAANPPRDSKAAEADLQEQVNAFNIPDVLPHTDHLAYDIGSSKHLVAIGALLNATNQRQQELNQAATESRVPAGYDIQFAKKGTTYTVPWNRTIGGGGDQLPFVADSLAELQTTIDRNTGPNAPGRWVQALERAMPSRNTVPSDAAIKEKMAIENGKLSVGPLQIILEYTASRLRRDQ